MKKHNLAFLKSHNIIKSHLRKINLTVWIYAINFSSNLIIFGVVYWIIFRRNIFHDGCR